MMHLNGSAVSHHSSIWIWLLILLFLALATWVAYTFIIAPILRKRHILDSIPYCPSLLLPQLPEEYNKVIKVPSSRWPQIKYRVNLFHLTCSCLRFRRFRQFYPPNDIRRLCRHLRKEMKNTECDQLFDELTRGLIAAHLRDACYIRESLSRSEAIFGFHPRSSIVRIYTFRKSQVDPPGGPYTGPMHKFTYNYRQDVWVYGEPPPNSEEILQRLEMRMSECRSRYPQPSKLPLLKADTLPTPIPESEAAKAARARRERILSGSRSTTPLQKP